MATPSLQSPKKPEKQEKGDLGRCVILKEDVNVSEISRSDLTSDCYFIHRKDGKVDVARGSAVHIFDSYYDKGIFLTQIEMSGGSLNPKLTKPQI